MLDGMIPVNVDTTFVHPFNSQVARDIEDLAEPNSTLNHYLRKKTSTSIWSALLEGTVQSEAWRVDREYGKDSYVIKLRGGTPSTIPAHSNTTDAASDLLIPPYEVAVHTDTTYAESRIPQKTWQMLIKAQRSMDQMMDRDAISLLSSVSAPRRRDLAAEEALKHLDRLTRFPRGSECGCIIVNKAASDYFTEHQDGTVMNLRTPFYADDVVSGTYKGMIVFYHNFDPKDMPREMADTGDENPFVIEREDSTALPRRFVGVPGNRAKPQDAGVIICELPLLKGVAFVHPSLEISTIHEPKRFKLGIVQRWTVGMGLRNAEGIESIRFPLPQS